MEGRDYLLGQFLQCADELHLVYCEHVRGGNVPPQLIGNAAMPMALENPSKALEVLGARVPVYFAWLTQKANSTGVSSKTGGELNEEEMTALKKKAKWLSRRLADLSARLHGQLTAPVSLTGRAELLLGYLAREPRTDSPSAPHSISDRDAQLTAIGENA